MRLSSPFVRIPLVVDATRIAVEVDALPDRVWRPHPEGAPGNSAVPLVARDGDPDDDRAFGMMRSTPHLERLPYTRRVLAALDSVIGRSRLMRIEEEGELGAHVDTNYYWRDHLRVHVPVHTSPAVRFTCEGESVHMGPGEVWVFDTWRPHSVINPADAARVHLVVDTVGGVPLWNLIDAPEREPVAVAVDGPEPTIPTETVNRPWVMSPWELEHALTAIADELMATEPELGRRLRSVTVDHTRAWRNLWARYGDAPAGRVHFGALRDELDRAATGAVGDARLRNGVTVLEAVRQHALRQAVAEEPNLRVATAAPESRSPRVTIDRPVFVVSSPRAGSSLLYETLARARDLTTIGGESHQVIESIVGLRPQDHEWSSNRLVAEDATPRAVAALHAGLVASLRDRDGEVPPGGPVRVLEKTPKNSLRVPFLAAAFPDSRFVYLYRDPRETVSSMLDAWRSGRFVTYPRLPGWHGPPWSLLLTPGWRDLNGRALADVVTAQWSTATTVLLDDLEALDPERWCVASYGRLVADPQAEMERLCAFAALEWDVEVGTDLPLSRHTLDAPQPDKWRRNADELRGSWDRVTEVATRAHDVFAAPPRIHPARVPPATATQPAPEPELFHSVHSDAFPQILEAAHCSLIASTYQSGRLIVVRSEGRQLNTHFRALPSPMGVARRGGSLAVGTKSEVLVFQNQPEAGARLDPPDRHDAVFMPRRAYATGDIRIHDLAYAGEELWAVNTRFSCLVTFDDEHSFVPRWRPPFVSAYSAGDRCHLNGLAVVDDEPRFVTALGRSDVDGGWRDDKATGGVVLEVPSGEPVVTGLCMPHSPRWHDGKLWVLESGRGTLGVVDLGTGRIDDVAAVPGFARGLGFAGPYAFIGLSQVREHVFEGLPLTGDGIERHCGVWVVDTRSGHTAAFLRFEGIVQEIFEVAVLEGLRYPEVTEPRAELADTAFVLPDDAIADLAPLPSK